MQRLRKIPFYVVLSVCNNLLKGTHFFELKRILLNSIGISVGRDTKIVGPVNIGSAAKLRIGTGNWIGTNLTIYGNGTVIIGDNNDLAPDVTFVTGSHEIGDKRRRAGAGISHHYAVGDGNWIGAKATITNGAGIGSGVVVGAASLVTRTLENDHVYGGVPARILKELK